MAFTVKFELQPLPRGLRAPASIIRRHETRAIVTASNLMKLAVVRATPKVTTLTSLGWKTIVPRVGAAGRVEGGVEILGEAGTAALVLEEGAKQHFPPVPADPESEPALGAWIRNVRDFEPFVEEKGVRRPVVPGNLADVRKAAFKISAAIQARGLPRPGRDTRIFTKALDAIQGQINAVFKRMIDLIVSDVGKA